MYSDKCKALVLTILFLGPKFYRFLQNTWCFPNIRILQKVTKKSEINPSLNDFVFKVLKFKLKNLTDEFRVYWNVTQIVFVLPCEERCN